MVIELGITIIGPRWKRVKDPVKKFVMMLPLRDAAGKNVGLPVLAYRNDASWNKGKGEKEFFEMSATLRDGLQQKIPSYQGLFDAAK